MTDAEIILNYLETVGGWVNGANMSRDCKPGAVSWAYRSRISDMNAKFRANREPRIIQSRIGDNGMAEYRLFRELSPIEIKEDEIGQRSF